MTTKTATTEYTIDATGKKLGRVASEAAMILRGKNTPNFKAHALSGNKVTIINASKVDLAPVKLEKEYTRYSGYPGGITQESRERLIARKGYKEIFEKAIYGMLPANRLRKPTLKNLTITE